MNILFFVNDKVDFSTGVGIKITSQSKAMSFLSDDYYFIYAHDSSKYRVSSDGSVLKERWAFTPLLLRYQFDNLLRFIIDNNIELIYIRYTHFSSPTFLRFLCELKKHNIIIVLEFPTFPYDSEYNSLGFLSKVKLEIDKVFRCRLHEFVDYAVTFTENDKDILGMKTICISNAVDRMAIEKRGETLRELESATFPETIVFTAVSSMHSWHGIDRFINSIEAYIRKIGTSIKIKFNVVGDGPQLIPLKNMVEDKNLSQYVLFHGQLTGKELESILLSTHIGVDSLGRFRSGNLSNNSLKSKEYLSYGLPVLKSHIDKSIDSSGFVFNVKNDESIINIDNLLTLYQKLLTTSNRLAINEFCRSNFSWDVQLSQILESVSVDK
ncbi:glycosyltransferase [Shewanella marisflavi]|uniref:Glycosyltransferase family 4 protein n=1 Tax=Shewanella marisflavi TaxID=260364 RepID=A0AAC9U0W5_9GAMM|nr:glycosyltransferase [Shewanella marisflavi]ASJ97323.1 hypothetical protein CFF01_12455 [Shewanella marisflavi]